VEDATAYGVSDAFVTLRKRVDVELERVRART
jgi:hypothetical protein